ncbi:hypothetical protein [Halobacillus sp. KGW1]|uniref:hypothetical protein n=1 Tax=Halobacillus sp. KGW1 TaxID=1793726 RepID=UPI0007807A12|nr:hypothetical protein [Halobacillus sp. KGW1]
MKKEYLYFTIEQERICIEIWCGLMSYFVIGNVLGTFEFGSLREGRDKEEAVGYVVEQLRQEIERRS